jgi:hypothetical protein
MFKRTFSLEFSETAGSTAIEWHSAFPLVGTELILDLVQPVLIQLLLSGDMLLLLAGAESSTSGGDGAVNGEADDGLHAEPADVETAVEMFKRKRESIFPEPPESDREELGSEPDERPRDD